MKDLAKIEEIYHKALEYLPHERGAFLKDVCGADNDLLSEVESLLAFDEPAQNFFEKLPEDVAADFFNSRHQTNFVGTQLSHYRILSLLGTGGMGEVYLAEDTKLRRKIALKLLPSELASEPARERLFEQEAFAVSALNHPNIITIYGVEKSDGFNFIATEFIDGQTLRERITEKTFSWQEALEIGIQIADALDSAHSVGIIHRDIKPANIMIRRDGLLKVLDFGLAKLVEPRNNEQKETAKSQLNLKTSARVTGLSNADLTNKSAIMGTLNYMSPEQVVGQRLDTRSDIFSLGIVLYEMLSGVQPFRGETNEDIYQATINKSPLPLHKLNAEIPLELDRIISKAIEKDRDSRYQSVSDLRRDLLHFRETSNKSEILAKQTSRAKTFFPLVAVLAAILCSIGIYYFFYKFSSANNQSAEGLNFKYTQLTSQSGEELFPNLSPDGKTFIYSSREGGNWNIYLQIIGESNPINLTKDSSANDLEGVFSPDGKQIAFRSERDGGGIFVMSSNGEGVKRISDFGFTPSWSPDGSEILVSTDNVIENGHGYGGELWVINILTGEKRLITKEDSDSPSWSPNGSRIAFRTINSNSNLDIKTVSAAGGESLAVTDDEYLDNSPVWSSDGKYIYFLSNRSGSMNLWRVPVDEASGKVLGKAEQITLPSNSTQFVSFDRYGQRFAYDQAIIQTNIFKAEFNAEKETIGKNIKEITRGSKITTNPIVSDDEKLITFDSIGDKQEDIFIANADGSQVRQLTNNLDKDRAPRLSPDGKRIAYFTDTNGKWDGWIMNSDGSNPQVIAKMPENTVAQLPIWAPDGKRLIFNVVDGFPIIYDPEKQASAQTPQEIPHNSNDPNLFFAFSWSPDGNKLAGYIWDYKRNEPNLATFDFTTNKYEKLADFGYRPCWLADNRRIVFIERDKIYLLNTKTKKIKEIFSVAPYRLQSIWVTKNNRSIYYSLQKNESDIWLANTE